MRTEKITQTAEAFNENVNTSMKWFQESTALIFETQSKQMKFASEMYMNLLNSYFGNFESKSTSNPAFGTEKMTELIAINIDHIAKMAEENLKVLNEFSTQASSTLFVKESMEKLVDYYKKQIEMMTAFNQNAINAFMRETEISSMFMKPFSENLRNEFGLTSQLVNEGFKDMVASFTNLSNPSFDTNRKFVGDMANQMQSVFKNSIGLWAEILNNYSVAGTNGNHKTESTEKTTKQHEPVKEHASSKSKLHAAHV